MSLALMYYFITVAGGMKDIFIVSTGLSALTLLLCTVIGMLLKSDREDEAADKAFSFIKPAVVVLVISIFISIVIPSKKDSMIIAGLSLGEKGVTKVVEEAGEFYPLLKKVIKKELTEMAEEKDD